MSENSTNSGPEADARRRVKVYFELEVEDGYPPVATESVWALLDGSTGLCTLDNTPFFVREATYRDTVRVVERDGVPWFEAVVASEGHSLLRVVPFEGMQVEVIRTELEGFGCACEYFERFGLLSVDVPAGAELDAILATLESRANAGELDYEGALLRT